MKRALPWTIAAVALVAFGVSFFQLHEARERYWKLLSFQSHKDSELASFQSHNHPHFEVRHFIIKVALSDADRPIVVVGDSITEMARLPETINGHPVVNAGIGGATIGDFQMVAADLLGGSNPQLIAVALGTNDAGSTSIEQNYTALLSTLKKLSPRLVAVGIPDDNNATNVQIKAAAEAANVPFVEQRLPPGSHLSDHIHLNATGYRAWVPNLVAAISAASS